MQIDLSALPMRDAYKLMSGLIVPRPIGWLSTQGRGEEGAGRRNLAPFSYFNAVSSVPPVVSVSISNLSPAEQATRGAPDSRKDSLRNIQQTGEFVVHIVDEALGEAMNISAANFPPDVDEFERAELTAAPSERIAPPRVAEAAVAMECRLHALLPVGHGEGGATLVLGEVLLLHVRDDIINERYHVDLDALRPIGRLSGSDYVRVRKRFSMTRPKYIPNAE